MGTRARRAGSSRAAEVRRAHRSRALLATSMDANWTCEPPDGDLATGVSMRAEASEPPARHLSRQPGGEAGNQSPEAAKTSSSKVVERDTETNEKKQQRQAALIDCERQAKLISTLHQQQRQDELLLTSNSKAQNCWPTNRSPSITSDYFSSSHNSPRSCTKTRHQLHNRQSSDHTSPASNQLKSTPDTSKQGSSVIYENPAFLESPVDNADFGSLASGANENNNNNKNLSRVLFAHSDQDRDLDKMQVESLSSSDSRPLDEDTDTTSRRHQAKQQQHQNR